MAVGTPNSLRGWEAGRPRGPMPAQHRATMSAALKGKPKTAEHRAAISAGLKRAYAEGRR